MCHSLQCICHGRVPVVPVAIYRLRNDLYCVRWGVKPCSIQSNPVAIWTLRHYFLYLLMSVCDGVFLSPGMRLWKLEYGAFMRDAQVNYCRRLIIVPLTTFHLMADIIGDPKGELILLINIPRSGSTLLTQV